MYLRRAMNGIITWIRSGNHWLGFVISDCNFILLLNFTFAQWNFSRESPPKLFINFEPPFILSWLYIINLKKSSITKNILKLVTYFVRIRYMFQLFWYDLWQTGNRFFSLSFAKSNRLICKVFVWKTVHFRLISLSLYIS